MKTRQNVLLSRTKDKSDKEQAFNAMLLRNKALIWHICSDYNLGKVWNVEDCMQEVIVSLWRYCGSRPHKPDSLDFLLRQR